MIKVRDDEKSELNRDVIIGIEEYNDDGEYSSQAFRAAKYLAHGILEQLQDINWEAEMHHYWGGHKCKEIQIICHDTNGDKLIINIPIKIRMECTLNGKSIKIERCIKKKQQIII